MDYNLKAAEGDAEAREAYHTQQRIEYAQTNAQRGLSCLDDLPTLQDPAREAALEEAYHALEAAVTALGKVLEAGE